MVLNANETEFTMNPQECHVYGRKGQALLADPAGLLTDSINSSQFFYMVPNKQYSLKENSFKALFPTRVSKAGSVFDGLPQADEERFPLGHWLSDKAL